MVVHNDLSDADVDRIFHALADATRRDIVRRTLTAETCVSDLADAYDMSFAAVQKHVAVLQAAGLVTKRVAGRQRLVCADPRTIGDVRRLLADYERLWRARVDRLDTLFAQDPDTSGD